MLDKSNLLAINSGNCSQLPLAQTLQNLICEPSSNTTNRT
jgi:hypothetical protein